MHACMHVISLIILKTAADKLSEYVQDFSFQAWMQYLHNPTNRAQAIVCAVFCISRQVAAIWLTELRSLTQHALLTQSPTPRTAA